MAIKKIIENKPEVGMRAQYNFEDGYTEDPPVYEDSISLPENYDKFSKKDLYSTTEGDTLNELIIDYNLKYEEINFIRMDKIFISNAGVNYDVRGIDIRGYLFSAKAYMDANNGRSIEADTYDDMSFPATSRFFRYQPSSVAEGNDIGSLTFVQGENVVQNMFNTEGLIPEIGDFSNSDSNFTPLDVITKYEETDEDLTSLFDESQYNPLYIAFYMKGDADRWWGTDQRKRRKQVFKINNLDVFNIDGDTVQGTVKSFDSLQNFSKTGGGGSGGAESAAWKITDFQITINTTAGGVNDFDDADDLEDIIGQLAAPINRGKENFLTIGPDRQLFNNKPAGQSQTDVFPDFFVKTTVGISNQDSKIADTYADLQTFYSSDDFGFFKSSAPATITFNLEMMNDELNALTFGNFKYFVVSWDDANNEINNLQDFLIKRPNNLLDYTTALDDNLYKEKNQFQLDGQIIKDNIIIKNTYNTPGIKNLKIIVFSYDGSEVGRWKLVTCRFNLGISLNELPDFGEVGGADYTTLPWPHITPIIGGVDSNSNYKTSVQDTLSGGNIRELDLIDEKLLLEDLENDEMGKSVKVMDLEQCRYFNHPHNMGTLLNIYPPIEYEPTPATYEFIGIVGIHNITSNFNITLSIPFTGYNSMPEGYEFADFPTIELNINTYAAAQVFGGNPHPLNGDYQLLNEQIDPPQYFGEAIDDENRLWKTYAVFRVVRDDFSLPDNKWDDFNYWDGETPETTFPEESSVGQIFINDNQDIKLKDRCKLELNMGELTKNTIYDSSGNSNKGLMIGEYKVTKQSKTERLKRQTFIKVPKKENNSGGAL
jgi:hypothetical protein